MLTVATRPNQKTCEQMCAYHVCVGRAMCEDVLNHQELTQTRTQAPKQKYRRRYIRHNWPRPQTLTTGADATYTLIPTHSQWAQTQVQQTKVHSHALKQSTTRPNKPTKKINQRRHRGRENTLTSPKSHNYKQRPQLQAHPRNRQMHQRTCARPNTHSQNHDI